MSDCALVVGIERYARAAAPLQGPSLDALRFALLLKEVQGVPPANIILIHNKCDDWAGELDKVYKRIEAKVTGFGIQSRTEPSRAAIQRAWREELPAGADEEGTLWIYWSGHGVTFPINRDAVLCSELEAGNPSFIYLAELRDSLRSQGFRHFQHQRLIVDACAEYIDPEALGIRGFRDPEFWDVTETPEQIEVGAVAMGRTARAEKGGSLFSRILVRELQKDEGWHGHLPTFFEAIEKSIREEAPDEQLPRLRILSPRFEFGAGSGRNVDEIGELMKILTNCEISFARYRPLYVRTMGGLTSDADVLAASTLTAMLEELLQLKREETFGRMAPGLAEFLYRVVRDFRAAAKPLSDWLSERVPLGARSTIEEKLDREATQKDANVDAGLNSLAKLVGQANTRDLVFGYRAEFERADERLYQAADMKQLHDWLHKVHLEFYRQLAAIRDRFPASIVELKLHLRKMERKVEELAQILKPSICEILVLKELPSEMETIVASIRQAADTKQIAPLEDAIFGLDTLLGSEMPRVDAAIVQSANGLMLQQLGQRLLDIYQRLALSGTLVAELDTTAQSLFSLHQSLQLEVGDHNGWQRIDNEIRLFGSTLRRPPGEVKVGWRLMKRHLTERTVQTRQGAWSRQLLESIELMDAALTAEDVNQVNAVFVDIREITEEQFDRADNLLLEDCDKLRPIANGMNLLLSRIL